jgi:predicted DNA-binding protein
MTDGSVIGKGMIAFRLPAELVLKLDRLAQETDRTLSSVLRELLRQAQARKPDLGFLRDPKGGST